MVVFANLCLRYLNVSFYYLARSLTTVFNVIFSYFILGVSTSYTAVFCCLIILFGYFLGVNFEAGLDSLTWWGVITGLLSSITCSLNSIWTAKVLPFVDGSAWLLTYYNNLNSLLFLLPAVLLESQTLSLSPHLVSVSFWTAVIASGVLGLAVGYASALQIRVTSPLTHNVSGTAKAAFQTVLAVLWFNEAAKPVNWWISNVIVLMGSLVYAYVRHYEAISNLLPSRLRDV